MSMRSCGRCRDHGHDFGHGTGHGVGIHVHEGGVRFAPGAQYGPCRMR